MPNYEPRYTKYTDGSVNVMMRLTHQDTIFLGGRVAQALQNQTGVSLVYLSWRGALSLTRSPERGKQVKCIVFENKGGIRVESEMKGYNGPWSHIEFAFPIGVAHDMVEFTSKLKELQPDTVRL